MKLRSIILVILITVFHQVGITSSMALGTGIAVTEAVYDDIGSILNTMGPSFSFTQISQANLADTSFNLDAYDQLYINCAGGSYSTAAKDRLTQWVNDGGSLYASDWAYSYVNESFPGYVVYPASPLIGNSQTVTSNVTNAGLAWYINPASPPSTLTLNYNLGAWAVIDSVMGGVTTYLEGTYSTSTGTMTNKPLAVGFSQGRGRVVYTTFHNEAQLSATQRKFIEYMVLANNLNKSSKALDDWLKTFSPNYEQLNENFNTINPGATSPTFTQPASGGENLMFGEGWGGSSLKLSVYKPDGSLYKEVDSSSPPAMVYAPNATAGNWTYTVTGTSVPNVNYPYVTIVGKTKQLATKLTLKAKPKRVKRGKRTRLTGKLKDAFGKILKRRKLKVQLRIRSKRRARLVRLYLKYRSKYRKAKTSKLRKRYKKLTTKYKKKYKKAKRFAWKTVGKAKTSKKGKFTVKAKMKKSAVFRIRYTGSKNYASSNSKGVRVRVR